MAIVLDPILSVNLVLCIIIVVLGILLYRKSHSTFPLFIAAAFGLFGISHAATLLGFIASFTIFLILIQALAYLLVIYALVIHLKTSMMTKEAQQAWVDFFQEESRQPPSQASQEKEREQKK
jgi:cellulose synthase/poly-beta-1,6-N-acetylglucosamine synthase-like glycosyltransferase